jgi:hypothetical protein
MTIGMMVSPYSIGRKIIIEIRSIQFPIIVSFIIFPPLRRFSLIRNINETACCGNKDQKSQPAIFFHFLSPFF